MPALLFAFINDVLKWHQPSWKGLNEICRDIKNLVE